MYPYSAWHTPIDPTYLVLVLIIFILVSIDMVLFAIWLYKRSNR